MTIDEARAMIGDKVIWRHESRGGYGYVSYLSVTVLGVSEKRVLIEVPLNRGGTKTTRVHPDSLSAA